MRLMGHIVACFPDMQTSLESARGIIAGGAEFLEVQFPFSDPNADGVIIQNACDKALANGFSIQDGFAMVESLHNDAKIIIVTYANIVYKYGIESFVRKAKNSGAWGIIVPDLLFDNDEHLYQYTQQYHINFIHLITPNTPKERMKHIIAHSSEIVYIVARRGITGQTTDIDSALREYLRDIKDICHKDIALGFGINSKEQITKLDGLADIIVIGSHFVQIIASLDTKDAFQTLQTATKALMC